MVRHTREVGARQNIYVIGTGTDVQDTDLAGHLLPDSLGIVDRAG